MKNLIQTIFASAFLASFASQAEDISKVHKGEEKFYKGSYGAPGDYILNGELIKDLPPPLEVPVDYKAPSFDASKLSPVPKVGIHPRIIIGPEDIERFKELHKMGQKAPRIYKLQMEQMRRDAEKWKVPANFNYRTSPWGEDSKIAGWGLYALITEDQELGKKAAKATVEHALYLEGRVDILNTDPIAAPIKDVAYDFLRREVVFGQIAYHDAYYQGGKARVEQLYKKHGATLKGYDFSGTHLSLAFEYDYAYPFMSEQERTTVRRVISKCTYGKYTTGMQIPGQMYINNHMSGSANQIYLALAIEGEKGYDPRVAKMAEWSLKNKLSYDLSSNGITYENTKGFIPMLPVLAIAKRQGPNHPENLLKHSHLLARANSNLQHARKIYYRFSTESRRRPDGKSLDKILTGLDEARYWMASGASGSGGHLEFWSVMKHFYPEDKLVDFVWNAKLPGSLSYFEGTPKDNWSGKIHHNWFSLKAINLLTATQMTDYNKLDNLEEFKDVEKFWFDDERGITSARNDWSADSMLFHLENRIDQYYMGHESPQHGDFQVWADGIPWVSNGGGYIDTSFRNMVTVDGLAGVYAPISGDWMTAKNTEIASNSVSEMTSAYQWRKSLNGLRYLDHPGLESMPSQMQPFAKEAYSLDRFSELAYLPKIREHYDGFAHLDYGPWHGETRGPEYYYKWNDPMDHVFRTTHFARGKKPYLLIFDDLRKADDQNHQFDWRMMITGDAAIYSSNPKAKGRHTSKSTDGVIGTDLIFCMADKNINRHGGNAWGLRYIEMKPKPKKGDPMLLVRILWRNTNYAFPVPNVQRSYSWNMVSVPAFGKSPEYRVMVYPYKYGENLPTTEWSDDRTRLTVKIGENIDTYDFSQTDRERTVYSMKRNGKSIIDSNARPPKPVFISSSKFTVDQNRPNWRAPQILVDTYPVKFKNIKPGAQVYYTLDGSEPNAKSAIYDGTLAINKSCTLKAKTYQADWRYGKENWSETVSIDFEKQTPQQALALKPQSEGLLLKGYEIKTTKFDQKGFFQGDKNSLPNIQKYTALMTHAVKGFYIPKMNNTVDSKWMTKAFYNYSGYIQVPESGVYSFELESAGPIDFKVSDQSLILVDKQYGLSYKKRYGDIALSKGTHKFELTVCDPVFWKGDMEEDYKINLALKAPRSSEYVALSDSALSRNADKLEALSPSKFSQKNIAAKKLDVLPGLIQKRYDRLDIILTEEAKQAQGRSEAKLIPASGLPLEYFDVSSAKPYSVSIADLMISSNSPRKLLEYEGYIRIGKDGVYEFDLAKGSENASQLIIANKVIVRRRVNAEKVNGKIALSKGLHPFRFQIAMGSSLIRMKHESESDFQTLIPAALAYDSHYKLPKLTAGKNKDFPAGLIAYMPCDKLDSGSSPVLDSKGASTVVSGGQVINDGIRGEALGIYGEAGRITFSGLRQREDEFTISAWIKYKDRPQDIVLWGEAYGNLNLRCRANRFIANWSRNIGNVDVSLDKKKVAADKWFHIAATYGKNVTIYFNGEKIAQKQVLNYSSRKGNGFFQGGKFMHCNNKPTAVDEVRLFDRALNAEEIKKVYNIDKP